MKKSKIECNVHDCFMCGNCIREWHPAIVANKVNYKVKRGDVVFNEGDQVKGVYFVYEGVIKVHKKWGTDKELILRFASKGDIFGHRGLGGNNLYPVSATALEDGTICYVDMTFFESSLTVNAGLTYNLMSFFANELKDSEKKMRNLAHMSVKGRVAEALISLQAQFGNNVDGSMKIELSRQDLASYAGATYETVFRVLNELSKESIVSTSGKKITIISVPKLSELTAEQP